MKKLIKNILSFFLIAMLILPSINNIWAKEDQQEFFNLTINYYLLNSENKQLHKPYNTTLEKGQEYQVKSPQIENYKLNNEDDENITGILNEDTVINVFYISSLNTNNINTIKQKETTNTTPKNDTNNTQASYTVSSNEELSTALEQIKNSSMKEAEIILTKNISLTDKNFGIKGKTIALKSNIESNNYSISISNENAFRLSGNVIFENVKIGNSRLYAQGNTVEFSQNYTQAGLRLYGGSDYNLDLMSNGDEDKSTHIIIRNGKFHSIVGGNTDTFDQGKYHEYANWSDETTNVHTTLTGDTKIEIYGGSFGGNYNIDVGDTCCNTSVTPARLYGGGLGSDTIGNTNVTIHNLDDSTYNNSIVGAGFGMGGDKDDPTILNDKIKHTGIVTGDVNLNILGGNIPAFYAGGFHNGSAHKPQYNVSTERSLQRQYNRDKIATVGGDVNVTIGGEANIYQGGAYAGSYASTIFGNINVKIQDNAKISSKKNARTPSDMNDLINTYKGDYNGAWYDAFYASGEYDIIEGTVNIDINGGYIRNIQVTPFTDPFSVLDLENTEIKNKGNEKYAININAKDGIIQEIYAVYESGKINGSIQINVSENADIFNITGYRGANGSFTTPKDTTIDINVSNADIYGIHTVYGTNKDNIQSNITYSSDNKNTINGYVMNATNVYMKENADVTLDAALLMDRFNMPQSSYGADKDSPFYENTYNLYIEPSAKLTTCKNETTLLGEVENKSGNWISNGKVTIKQNLNSENGMIFLKEPSIINGNAAWNNTQLRLPVITNNNYDGTNDIALTINNTSSGSANVLLVNKEDYTEAVNPKQYDNYILSNGDKNKQSDSEIIYHLANDNKNEGFYLKSVDDLATTNTHNNMWQVAKETTYGVLYGFQSGTKGKGLTDEIINMLPLDENQYIKGATVNAIQPQKTTIEEDDGIWIFQGYKEGNSQIVSDSTLSPGADPSDPKVYIHFNGVWKFFTNKYDVNYDFVSSNPNVTLPNEVINVKPENEADKVWQTQTAEPSVKDFDNITTNDGVWIFEGWDKDKVENVSTDVTFTGTWSYYKYHPIEALDLSAYEGGYGTDSTSTNVGNGLPNPTWDTRLSNYKVYMDGELWDTKEKGYPFQIEYLDEEGNPLNESARVGTYDLYAKPLDNYENSIVTIKDENNQFALYLPKEGVKISSVDVKDVTNNDAADTLSDKYFKTLYDLSSRNNILSLFSSVATFNSNHNGVESGECDKTQAHAHVDLDITFYKNEIETLEVNDNSKVKLLWDNLLPDVLGSDDNMKLLETKTLDLLKAEGKLDLNKTINNEYKYLDLVDTNDGNLWVGTKDEDVLVFCPYPKGVTKDDNIELIYFDNLTRDYTVHMDKANLEQEIIKSNASIVNISKEEKGITFNVPSKKFGVFELVWQNDDSITNEYNVNYEFISSDKNITLPKEVTNLIPSDNNKYKEGTTVKAIMPKSTKVETSNGVWTFKGYDKNEKTVNGNITFTGTWKYNKNSTASSNTTSNDGSNINTPNTKDDSNIILYLILMILSIVSIFILRKKIKA